MAALPLSSGPTPVLPRMPANEANADQDPDSAKHSCNSIDRRHDCGWRTASGNMGKDEGDTALGSHVAPPRCAMCNIEPPAQPRRSSGVRRRIQIAIWRRRAALAATRLDSHAPELHSGKLRLQKILDPQKKISRFRVAIIPNRIKATLQNTVVLCVYICLMSPICPMETAPFPQELNRSTKSRKNYNEH
jgi:hypothetical protein